MHEPVVVVTGASTGIGKATALHLDTLGFRVFAGVRREEDGEALAREASDRLRPMFIDVTDGVSITTAVDAVTQAVADSRLAGIVNNAGIAVAGPFECVPLDDFRKQFEVNLLGHIAMTQAFLPLLRESEGRIVFVGSIGGRFPQPFMAPYCASKAAIESITDILRIELRPWNISVSVVEPGSVATPIWDKGSSLATAMAERASPEIRQLYGAAIRTMEKIAQRESGKGMAPHRVAVAIAHALVAPRPRTRYVVGRDAKAMVWLKRLLPDRVRDAVIARYANLPRTAADTAGPVAAPDRAKEPV